MNMLFNLYTVLVLHYFKIFPGAYENCSQMIFLVHHYEQPTNGEVPSLESPTQEVVQLHEFPLGLCAGGLDMLGCQTFCARGKSGAEKTEGTCEMIMFE